MAIESEDRWVIAHATWSAALVPSARGDWESAERLEREIARRARDASSATRRCRRSSPRSSPRRRSARADVLATLAPLAQRGTSTTPMLPWQHLQAHALVDAGRLDEAAAFIAEADALAPRARQPLLAARLCARARQAGARAPRRPTRATEAFETARGLVEPLGMPYEQALIELAHAQLLRRDGKRRAASSLLLDARGRLTALRALPALRRCEQELTACGLTPAPRSARDYARLTPQETAVDAARRVRA